MDIFTQHEISEPEDALKSFLQRELRITHNGVVVPFRYYYRAGESIPLIFVHGWGASATIWSYLALYLPPSTPLVILDLPGHGQNRNLPNLEALIAFDFIFEVLDTILDLLDQKAILVGHSMGGGIVQNYALNHRSRVAGLILVSTALTFRSFLPPALVDLLISSASRLAESLGEQFASYLAPRFLRESDLPEEIQVTTTRSLVNTLSTNDDSVIVLEYRNLIRPWDGRKTTPLTFPILILVGELDLLTPLTQAEEMNMHYPNSLLKIIPQAHHNLPLFNFKRVGDAMEMFLKLLSPPS
ncbi:MAG: alpha/beta hydrolase [Methanobacteriota archaeon]|nr:MAG: alpha/beta hydrolase [Euryarchaeota archaeon]